METNILVVDDEKEIAELVEIYLVSDGYKVFKASNAQEGLDILNKEDIHLVLLDIMMPGMDGMEMCRKIRETSNIPIIMLSAKSTDLDKILGLGTGADDYVVKPFDLAVLYSRKTLQSPGADGPGEIPAAPVHPVEPQQRGPGGGEK